MAFGVVDNQPVIVSASTDRMVRVWDARSSRSRRVIVHQPAVAIAALGSLVAVGTTRAVLALDLSANAVTNH